MIKRYACSVLLIFAVSICAAAQSNAALDSRIRAEVAQLKGKVSLFAKNLDTGATYELNADNRVRTASTIKLPIMVEAFARVAEGKAKWSDEVVYVSAKKVTGSGVLQDLSDGLRLTLRDAVTLMIILSDNSATNLVLDVVTTDAVNARMDALGLKQTRVLRKVGGGGTSKAGEDEANKPFGLGVTTPREMVMLLEKIETGHVVSKDASKEMIAIMKREQDNQGIGRTLRGVPTATKSGALDRLRSDIGVVYSKGGRIAMAITVDDMTDVYWSVDNPAHLLISRLSSMLIDGLSKQGN